MTRSTIGSEPTLRPPDTHSRPVTSQSGAGAAFVVASTAAGVAFAVGAGSLLVPGIPAATVVGYVLGPSVQLHGSNASAALRMSFFTVLIGDFVVVLAMGIGSMVFNLATAEFSPVRLLGELANLWVIGLLIYGLPVLAFVVGPCTIAWILLVTWLARRATDNETR